MIPARGGNPRSSGHHPGQRRTGRHGSPVHRLPALRWSPRRRDRPPASATGPATATSAPRGERVTSSGPVLVASASGFVGRRLCPTLIDEGHDVRAMTRRPDSYSSEDEAVYGDVHAADTLPQDLTGCRAAYSGRLDAVHAVGADHRRHTCVRRVAR
ncbi:MAG: NAD(P)H-binding protein [Nocardioides sp.]|nr:NAD(P)H-binding protein [Nocardioides sp.]